MRDPSGRACGSPSPPPRLPRWNLAHLLGDALGLQEQQQVIAAAGLGIGAAHVEPAEGMRPYDRARALAVHVEVADEELALGALDLLRVLRVDGAGQAVVRRVRDRQRLFEGLYRDHR